MPPNAWVFLRSKITSNLAGLVLAEVLVTVLSLRLSIKTLDAVRHSPVFLASEKISLDGVALSKTASAGKSGFFQLAIVISPIK